MNFRRIWQVSLAVAVLMFIIGMATDDKDVRRYADEMERLMAKGDYQKALEVGSKSYKTDRRLLQLRIEALAHEHQLGERLFAYPIVGRGSDLVKKGGDYALCGYLIDKQLDRFAELLPKYYKMDNQLPRYYREALIQYNHVRSHPRIVFHDNVLDTDYRDMQQLEAQHSEPEARQMAVFRQYEGTYWYYYGYLNTTAR
jgi:hypothetical protein